ncbi:MAG: hypothetical protein Q9195_000466 [Heterodermia aff. obscurata]
MAQSSADTAVVRYATEAGTPSPFQCGQASSPKPKVALDLALGELAARVCAQIVASPAYLSKPNVPIILTLIQELAAYEHASDSVLATEDTLRASLSFPSNPSSGYAKTLLIFPRGSSPSSHCAGMALFFNNYSTWRAAPGIYLEDLFVRPEFRGLGYGKRLLGELALEVKKIGGKRLEWSVLKWNEPSINFYKSIGAQQMDEWVGMRVDTEAGLSKIGAWGTGVEG